VLFPDIPPPPPVVLMLENTEEDPLIPKSVSFVFPPEPPPPTVTVYAVPGDTDNVEVKSPPAPPPPLAPPPPPATTKYSTEDRIARLPPNKESIIPLMRRYQSTHRR
jgi:hypothetical protein